MNIKVSLVVVICMLLSSGVVIGMNGNLRLIDQAFLRASQNDQLNEKMIDNFCAQQANFEVAGPTFTGLDWICLHKNFEVLKLLLTKKIYTVDRVFFSACETHKLDDDFISFILAQGGSINAIDPENGYTGLHYACLEGALKACKLLMDRGAAITLDSEGNSLLHTASTTDISVLIVDFLIKSKKFNINEKNKSGLTPLHYACANASPEVVQQLLDAGALQLPDIDGSTPLHIIYHRESDDAQELINIMVKLINNDRSIVNEKNKIGRTPLHIACEFLSPDIVGMLIECGAEQMRDYNGESPLEACEYNQKYNPEVIQYILREDLKSQQVMQDKIVLQDVTNVLFKKKQTTKKNKKQSQGSKTKKKNRKKVKKVLLQEEKKETLGVDQNNELQENILSSEKVNVLDGKTSMPVKLEKPKKTLIEKAQSFVVKAVTGSSSQEVVVKTYAAAVNLGQEQKAPEKRLHTFRDDYLDIAVLSEIYPKLIADHETNPLATKHCSDHVERKMAKPDDYLHKISYEAQMWLGQFAHLKLIKDEVKTYIVPNAQVALPRGTSFNGSFEIGVAKDNKTHEDIIIHKFFNPDNNGKNIPLLLPSSQ